MVFLAATMRSLELSRFLLLDSLAFHGCTRAHASTHTCEKRVLVSEAAVVTGASLSATPDSLNFSCAQSLALISAYLSPPKIGSAKGTVPHIHALEGRWSMR